MLYCAFMGMALLREAGLTCVNTGVPMNLILALLGIDPITLAASEASMECVGSLSAAILDDDEVRRTGARRVSIFCA